MKSAKGENELLWHENKRDRRNKSEKNRWEKGRKKVHFLFVGKSVVSHEKVRKYCCQWPTVAGENVIFISFESFSLHWISRSIFSLPFYNINIDLQLCWDASNFWSILFPWKIIFCLHRICIYFCAFEQAKSTTHSNYFFAFLN